MIRLGSKTDLQLSLLLYLFSSSAVHCNATFKAHMLAETPQIVQPPSFIEQLVAPP